LPKHSHELPAISKWHNAETSLHALTPTLKQDLLSKFITKTKNTTFIIPPEQNGIQIWWLAMDSMNKVYIYQTERKYQIMKQNSENPNYII
jgi:hypothetical protein